MEELFGVSLNAIMAVLLVIFAVGLGIVVVMALRSRIMLKLALRNIPRRRAQTILIIVGVMLSTMITAAAFGTGDTISHSIRKEGVTLLGPIDEIIFSARASSEDRLGTSAYISQERFEQLKAELAGLDTIDGLAPGLGETVPAVNVRTNLSEGRMRVAGVDSKSLEGFGTLTLVSGGEAHLGALSEGEAYINKKAADELDAMESDEIRLHVEGETVVFRIRGVVVRGGLAGEASTLILPLERAQALFGREGQINSIIVSNRGDVMSGAEHSEEVTRRLRVLFADPAVATQLKELLSSEEVLAALKKSESSLGGDRKDEMVRLQGELGKDEVSEKLIDLLSDEDVSNEVLDTLNDAGLSEIEGRADTLFSNLGELRVLDIKRFFIDIADQAGSAVTTVFIVMGLFSILVGVLLIFLIFVMLAAARRSEMGMARAVGAKRVHLVQMFVFEGTAYALVAAALGVLLGWALSTVMILILNWIIGNFDIDFRLSPLFKARSAIVAYCLGMVITFATVYFSAYRVSRMNIVAAVRGLPDTLLPAREPPLLGRLLYLPRAVGRPLIFLFRGLTSLPQARFAPFLVNTGLAIAWVVIFPVWIVDVVVAVLRFVWPYVLRGWLTLLLGLLIVHAGVSAERDSIFYLGGSLMTIGLGMMLRTALKRTSFTADLRDRIAFTATGSVILLYWALPPSTFEGLTGPLTGDIEMMFVSGVFMVAAAVWVVMYNADLLLRGLNFVTGRFGRLRPVTVTAVAYPMSAKFRTGLTLAMFSLVMFTVVVMSVIVDSFGNSIASDVDKVTGGWDVEGDLNFNTPVQDIRRAITDDPKLKIEDFEAVGGYVTVPVEARQIGAENQRWEPYSVWAADDDYLDATNHKLKLIASGYGPTEADVWQALKADPSLTVVEGSVVPTRPGGDAIAAFQLEGVSYEDATMTPVAIEVREPLTDVIVPLTVIGVLDRVHDPFELIFGMLTSKSAIDDAIPFTILVTTYAFRLTEGVEPKGVAKALEASFQENGMETEVLEEEIDRAVAGLRAFYYLLIGFMALGLIVGIAGLGVISTRAVVERRQQIGVLRAIGYRRHMIQLSFLIESSFIALLGIAIGLLLGATLSYNAISDIRTEEGIDTLRYSIPWGQVVIIIAIAYVFSLVTTFLPARQASRIHPAEALRYE